MKILQHTEISISFDRRAGLYSVLLNDEVFEQRICEFLYTFNVLSRKDPEEYLLNTDSKYDMVTIPLSAKNGKTVHLSIKDFLALRNAYMEEMFRLKVEDVLYRSGIGTSSSIFV